MGWGNGTKLWVAVRGWVSKRGFGFALHLWYDGWPRVSYVILSAGLPLRCDLITSFCSLLLPSISSTWSSSPPAKSGLSLCSSGGHNSGCCMQLSLILRTLLWQRSLLLRALHWQGRCLLLWVAGLSKFLSSCSCLCCFFFTSTGSPSSRGRSITGNRRFGCNPQMALLPLSGCTL